VSAVALVASAGAVGSAAGVGVGDAEASIALTPGLSRTGGLRGLRRAALGAAGLAGAVTLALVVVVWVLMTFSSEGDSRPAATWSPFVTG
jgi:hypothetical protein